MDGTGADTVQVRARQCATVQDRIGWWGRYRFADVLFFKEFLCGAVELTVQIRGQCRR